jgi:hypothetical protein
MRINGENIDDVRVMKNILRSLDSKFNHVMIAIEDNANMLYLFTIDDQLT